MSPKVSIITVSYNAGNSIVKTIESVLEQTYMSYEYVFIDGQSTDNTVDIIESYRAKFESKGIRFVVVSERDKGIYDAMNKGAQLAKGSWVLMLNAADQLVDNEVLASFFSKEFNDAHVLYGDTILRDGNFYKLSMAQPLDTITQAMPMCHQSIFVRRDIIQEYQFDLQYKVAADYNQLLSCYLDKKIFQYVPQIVSIYDVAGTSEKNFRLTQKEQEMVRRVHKSNITHSRVRVIIRHKLARILSHILPKWSRSEKRGWYGSAQKIKDTVYYKR